MPRTDLRFRLRPVLALGLVLVLSGCLPAIRKEIFPAYSCKDPGRSAVLGGAEGRVYLHWLNAGAILVLEVAPYGVNLGVGRVGDLYRDMDHVSRAWYVDAATLSTREGDRAWIDRVLAGLRQSRWDMKTHVGASIGSAVGEVASLGLAQANKKFSGTLPLADGRRLPYDARLEAGDFPTLRVLTAAWKTPKLFTHMENGGSEAAMLMFQVSPDQRYAKTDYFMADLADGRTVQLWGPCNDIESIAVNPAWNQAAVLYAEKGRRHLVVTPFVATVPQ